MAVASVGDAERELREHLLVGALHHRAQEGLAGAEMVVEHADVHARRLRHLADGEAGAAVHGKQFPAGGEEGAIEMA